MSCKSYKIQIKEHLEFLQKQGFLISNLKINAGFVRVPQVNTYQIRGELAYKTTCKMLDNGLTGLQTWFRGPGGITDRFLTYGMGPCGDENVKIETQAVSDNMCEHKTQHIIAARKSYGFWNYSCPNGRSQYLERKGVGYYGIRFRSDEKYGDVAIVPMTDENGKIWSYQILNPDGTKRHPKDTRAKGLYHKIGKPLNGDLIGITESYVSAVSCFELTDIPTVCVFSCHNLEHVGIILRKCYPNSPLIIFADNDNHLSFRGIKNQGCSKAKKAIEAIGENAILVEPEFEGLAASKDHSDWNDLVRLKGYNSARSQIVKKIRQQLIKHGIKSRISN